MLVIAPGPAGETPTPLADATRLRSACSPNIANTRSRVTSSAMQIDGDGATVGAVLEGRNRCPPTTLSTSDPRLAMEPISGVRKDSPAEIAGFRKGDRIKKVDGATTSTRYGSRPPATTRPARR